MRLPWAAPIALLGLLAEPLLVSGCAGSHSAAPIPPAADYFTDVASEAGLHYRWTIHESKPYTILGTIGNGCAFLDYNNDGNLDILLVGPQLALYRGDGHGHFTDVTHQTGLDRLKGHFLGCAVGDYDNDGFPDIYISAWRGGVLLHNERGQFFRDVTREAGIQPQPWGTSCAFADVNNDGRLDLYIANYVRFGPETWPQLCPYGNLHGACGPGTYYPIHGVLYLNEGNGKFRDVTKQWGADNVFGVALGVAFADYDGSGRQSLAVANDDEPGDLLQNIGGKFRNMGIPAGIAYDRESHVHAGMGIDWGDYDNDGRPDLVVGAFQHEVNTIYHNDGRGLFTEVSEDLGVAGPTTSLLTFGAKWLDYDNDGWLDLAFANGHVIDVIHQVDPSSTFLQPTLLLHNQAGQSFTDVSAKAGEAFQRPILGRGLAVGDFDNDGKPDLLIVNSLGSPLLLHNQTPGAGHWLAFRLTGSHGPRDATGAVVTVEAGGLKQTRRCGTDGSYLSASDPRVHFGLGKAASANRVTIRWPGGHQTELRNVQADQVIAVKE